MDDATPTERAGRTTWLLMRGRGYTTRSLANELGITPRGARYLLNRLSLVLPLVDDGGFWRVMADDAEEEDNGRSETQ